MSEIKFTCPQCSQPVEIDAEFAGESITCPGCGNVVSVPNTIPNQRDHIQSPNTEADKVKNAAFRTSAIAFASGGLGVIFLIIGIMKYVSGEDGEEALLTAGSLFGFGITLLFLAQLYHIRALLIQK